MTEPVSLTASPEGARYATVVPSIDGMKSKKDGYRMGMLDNHHPCYSVQMLRHDDDME